MHLGIISVADRVVHNIKSDDTKQSVLDNLYAAYNIKIIQKHDHKLDENNVQYVKSNPHLISLRSNGNRYFMYFTLYNDIPIIYLIDKKISPLYNKPRITLIRGLFAKDLYKNTLIDVEIVKHSIGNGWTCLFNDIIVYKGQHLTKILLPERLKILYELLENEYTSDKIIDIFEYKVKTYLKAYDESISELIDIKLNYTSRGIYFWPFDLKYKPKLYNFDDGKIVPVVRKTKDDNKFKVDVVASNGNDNVSISPIRAITPVVNSTEIIEIYMSKSNEPDIYNLYEGDNILTSKKIGIALIPNLTTSKMIREAFRNTNLVTTIKVKCAYNTTFNKWYPIAII